MVVREGNDHPLARCLDGPGDCGTFFDFIMLVLRRAVGVYFMRTLPMHIPFLSRVATWTNDVKKLLSFTGRNLKTSADF
jgi:hypothetical protein